MKSHWKYLAYFSGFYSSRSHPSQSPVFDFLRGSDIFTRFRYPSPPCPTSCALPHTLQCIFVQKVAKCATLRNMWQNVQPWEKCTLLSLLRRLQSFLCQVLQQLDILHSYILLNGFIGSANFLKCGFSIWKRKFEEYMSSKMPEI